MTRRLKYWFIAAAFGILPVILLGLIGRASAAAGLWYVAPGGNDSADCQTTVTPCATINAAIGKAGTGDTIEVATGTYAAGMGNQVVWITRSVTLRGGWSNGFAAQTGLSTVDGQNVRRGLTVSDTASAAIDRFAFQHGYAAFYGGGIQNLGSLTVTHSQIVSNSGSYGGGIYNSGVLTLTQSLVSQNSAQLDGGGLDNGYQGQFNVVSTTIAGNSAGETLLSSATGGGGIGNNGDMVLEASSVSGNVLLGSFLGAGIRNGQTITISNSTINGNSGGYGDGIYASGWHESIYNTTISGNSGNGLEVYGFTHITLSNSIISGNSVRDCEQEAYSPGEITSFGYNLIQTTVGCTLTGTDITGVNAMLGTLQDNGGAVWTQALLEGSPAINAGNPSGCLGPNGLLATDERGYPRQGRCDIGAFEVQPLDFSDKTVSQNSAVPGQSVRYTIRVSNFGGSPMSGVTVTDTLPAGLVFGNGSLTATSGIFNYSAGVITWTGSVNTGATVAIEYDAASQPNTSLGTILTNTALIRHGGQTITRQASVTIEHSRLFVPVVLKPQPGIWGIVTVNGAPASGVFLELRRFDGQHFSTQASGYTGPAGYYLFNPPNLPAGQFYYVRYLNTSQNPALLSYWATAEIDSFTPGSSVGAGNFDLADITLAAPDPGATLSLPALFQWVRRPATPTDSYQLSLFDPSGSAFGQTNLLGYVNGIYLTSVPSDFHSGTTYGWYVAVNSPGGGYGESYYYRPIRFNNVLGPSQPSVAGGAAVLPTRPAEDGPRR